jgi:fibronectin-binding autotransporter adhesin
MNVRLSYLVVFTAVLSVSQALAAPATLYYDTNGSTGGTSTTSTQNFTDLVWTLDSNGLTTTTGYTPGSDVVFSANDGVNVGTGTQSVTVQDTESADGFTFDNGIVTLFGSGGPNLSIGAGGITVNSTDGATTFDSSLGTVTLSADQAWDNDSTQALNVNSGITASGNTLSFNGTASGNVNLSGQLTGTLNLTQSSATSTLDLLNGNNNFTGTITASGGTIAFATPGSFGGGGNTIELDHGGTLFFTNDGFSVGALGNNVVLGTGGGTFASGVDDLTNDVVTGGTGLTITSGDFIPESNAASNVGTLNVTGGRLLAFGDGIFGNNAIVNVSSGATLDFGQGDTLNNAINLADGSALENRSGGISLTDVIMPTGNATVTLGADDVGGGSVTLNGPAINLANGTTLTLDINENHVNNPFNGDTSVSLNEAITGSGALTLTLIPGVYNEGVLFLNGNNSYSGPTTINAGLTVWTPDNTVSGNKAFGTSDVTLNNSSIDLNGGTLSNHVTLGTGNAAINLLAGASAETTTGLLETSATGSSIFLTNNSASNFTIGDYTADTNTVGGSAFFADQFNSTGSITFAGTYTSTTGTGAAAQIDLGFRGGSASANYYVAPTASFANYQSFNYQGPSAIDLFAGNLYLQNSSFVFGQFLAVTGTPGVNQTIQLVGAQTINAELYDTMKNSGTPDSDGVSIDGRPVINQSTPDESKWAGVILLNGTNVTLSAVSGGRLDITGDLAGGAPEGVDITGNGVVVLGNNDYNEEDGNGFVQSNATVAADLQSGTTLIENTGGGAAFGSATTVAQDPNFPGGTNHFISVKNIVKIEGGATLGGNGTVAQQLVAEGVVGSGAGASILAPGDAGQANLGINPSIGMLTLAGGLDAENGLTMDFKLTPNVTGNFGATKAGVDNDFITGTGFTLNGNITINITDIGGIATGTPYTLFFASNGVAGDPNFEFNVPTGYELDPNYSNPFNPTTQGYIFDPVGGTLTVQFIATPEPSTYALLGLGLLALVAIGRFRRLGNA